MLTTDSRITMSPQEFAEFQSATFAPWQPRTIAEFNAMCDLGSARHLVDNTGGEGFMHALAAEGMKFGEDGEANFPIDRRRMAYVKVHGLWPTDEQLRDFEAGGAADAVSAAPSLGNATSLSERDVSDTRRIVFGDRWYGLVGVQLVTGPINEDNTHNLAASTVVEWDCLDAHARSQCLRAKTVLVGSL